MTIRITCPRCNGTGNTDGTIGEIIKLHRNQKCYSQAEIEKITGISHAVLVNIENDNVEKISFDNIIRLCTVLGIPAIELIKARKSELGL